MKRIELANRRGIFITFEGGEGAGKSTLMELFAEEMAIQGHKVVKTREPGGTVLGESVRRWILDPNLKPFIGARAELMLFLAARAQHIEEVILPSLKEGSIVLCDRYSDSTIAYQGGGRELGIEYVTNLCELVSEKVVPDLTFLLDIDVDTGLARSKQVDKEIGAKGEGDRIESEEDRFHEIVLQTYRLIAEKNPERVFLLDAERPKQEVFRYACDIFNQFFSE